MTWTYAGSPGTSTAAERRDAVRMLVGDTDTNDQLSTDEEITFALSEASDEVYGAASIIARSIAASFARRVDTDVEGISTRYSQRSEQYEKLSIKLERESKRRGAVLGTPDAGGISISDIDSVEDNSDRPRPAFRRNQFNNPPGDLGDDEDNWFTYHR